MAHRATAHAARGRGAGPDLGKVYHLDSRCEVCERPIVAGQTWKFTPGGGKVHYYCEAKRNPAGPTYLQAMTQAHAAGARMGDTDAFEGWLRKAKLDGRSPLVQRKLKEAFWEGVDKGETKATSSARQDYHGAQVWKTSEGWKTSLDPDSDFDSLQDAKRFVDAQRNPRRRRTAPEIKLGPDYTVTVAGKAYYFKTLIEALRFYRRFRGVAPNVGLYRGDEFVTANPEGQENPFDFEASAREFGMNIATGRSLRIQVVRGRLRKAQKELAEHRAWLRSKDYEDDGVARKMVDKVRWLEIALDEYARMKRRKS